MKELTKKYFDYWNAHDLDGLRTIFAPNVKLKDWDIDVSGIDNVIAANKGIFDAAPNIKIEVLDMGVSSNKVMVEIVVDSGNGELIDVVDVITIANDQIVSIKAFKI